MDGINDIKSSKSLSALDHITDLGKNSNRHNTTDVSQKFEALLLFTMIKTMRSSLSGDLLAGSEQQNLYREMWDREIAEAIASSGGLGMQEMIENQLDPASLPSTTGNLELIGRFKTQLSPDSR